MFIPIGDDTPRYRMPYVTFVLIGLNVWIFAYMLCMDHASLVEFTLRYSSSGQSYNPLHSISAGFLHAGIIHLVGNMWFLFLFGSSVEGKLGHYWMVGTYFVCLLISDLVQYIFGHGNYTIALGASGAVGGLVGAYWFLFSRTRINFFYFVGFVKFGTIDLGVHWAIAWLFGWDLIWWVIEQRWGVGNGIAHGAHLGGLASGVLCGFLIRRFHHVTLDGDDMFTRFMVWKMRRNGRQISSGAVSASPKQYQATSRLYGAKRNEDAPGTPSEPSSDV